MSGRTINIELSLLRSILRHLNLWSRISNGVIFEEESSFAARVLSPAEKQRLFETARSQPRWFSAYCAAVLAANLSCRSGELRHLQWRHVNFPRQILRIETTKGRTAGVRQIPLNNTAVDILRQLRKKAEGNGLASSTGWLFPGRRCVKPSLL